MNNHIINPDNFKSPQGLLDFLANFNCPLEIKVRTKCQPSEDTAQHASLEDYQLTPNLSSPDEMGKFINALYNRQDGALLYGQIVQHFSQHLPEQEAVNFTQDLLNHCGPKAAALGLSLSSLTSLASSIVGRTKLYKIYDQAEVIMFISRSLVKSYHSDGQSSNEP